MVAVARVANAEVVVVHRVSLSRVVVRSGRRVEHMEGRNPHTHVCGSRPMMVVHFSNTFVNWGFLFSPSTTNTSN